MVLLAVPHTDVAVLRSILEAKLLDVHHELAHTDARRRRSGLYDVALMLEGLVEQLSPGPDSPPDDAVKAWRHAGASSPESGASDEDLTPRWSVPSSITQYLREHGVDYSVIHHHAAYTALREAAAAHVPGSEWAKAVACMADEQPALAVVPADHVVDMHRLRNVIGAMQLRLATEPEIAAMYQECEPGAMPPLGPLYGLRVFVDLSLASSAEITFNAGSRCDAIRMRYRDFEELVDPTVADFGRWH